MMKNKILVLLAVLLSASLFFVGCDEELDTPPLAVVNQDKLLTISDIYQIKADSGNNYVFTDDYMLYATVTMNDASGNIYKEAYIQDTTGGINLYKLTYAGSTEVGDYIRINLNGVTIVDYSGKLELVFGDYLDSDKQIIVQASNQPISPVPVTIEDVETGDYNCKLVEIQGIQFVDAELNRTYFYPLVASYLQPNRTAEDSTGRDIIIRTSEYADFANDTVPQGRGSMVAIVTKYVYSGGDVAWQLLIRSIDEVEMDEPRF